MTDCTNDCRDPIAFPRPVRNRPSLERIADRVGTYADIREALLHWRDADPVLEGWTHSGSDDAGVALLEGAAIIGDILTFYQDTYANEKFLRTASWRDSIGDIVRLIGYRLAPGVGGRATFAFQVRGDKPVTVPKAFLLSVQVAGREGQSDFETVESMTAFPALSRFPLYRAPTTPNIATGSSTLSVDTAALRTASVTIGKGDRLMLVVNPDATGSPRQIVVVDKVERRFERTDITIKGSWQGAGVAGATAYKLGRSFRYFGHNAPNKTTVVNNNVVSQVDVDFSQQVGDIELLIQGYGDLATQEPAPRPHDPLPRRSSIPLDQKVDDLSPGSIMLATLPLGSEARGTGAPSGDYFFERHIDSVHAETITRGSMTGATTVVDLDDDIGLSGPLILLGPPPLIWTDIRAVELHEVLGSRLAVTAPRAPAAGTDLSHLYFFGDAATYDALGGCRIQLARGGTVEETFVTADPVGSATGAALRRLTLNPPLAAFTPADFPLDEPKSLDDPAVVVAYGNLVDATQGRSERDAVLGNGDGRQAFQTFKLPKSPLTYHVKAGSTPPETPELEICVDGRKWSCVPSFFGRGAKEEVYVVREDANGDSWVQFGDGESGARLPSGLGNVLARYRSGNGAHGALRDDTTVQPGGRLDRLDKIRMLGLATGGEEPESADNARAAAPGKIQSLGRMVSITDYETEALAIQGVWRVAARWALTDNVPAIVLTILMKTGRAAELAAVRGVLAEGNRCRGPQRYPIVVVAGSLEYLYLGLSVSIDPSVQDAAVRARILEALGASGAEADGIDGSRGLLAAGRRQFGDREYATRIAGTAQNVPGVLWAQVDGLGSLGPADDPAALALPAAPWARADIVDCANDRILCLDRRHIILTTVAAPAASCA